LENSKTSAELLAAYRAAQYRVNAVPASFCILVGQLSTELLRLYAGASQSSAAFLTAFNPRSQQLSDEANSAAHKCLLKVLRALPVETIEGTGSDPQGSWPEERSVLALGLELGVAKSIGNQFNQNAIIWASADAVPRLVVLR